MRFADPRPGRLRPTLAAAGLGSLGAALALAGCGGASPPPSTTSPGAASASAPTTTTTTTTPRPASRHPRPVGAAIGAIRPVHAGGSRLLVRIAAVLDPLVAGGGALPPGTRPVGVVITIRNSGPATYDSTASGDVSLATSAGPASPLFVRHGRCQTPLTDFESLIAAGQTRTGCVGFSVHRGARVLGVRFSPHSRAPGSVVWR